MREHLQEMMGNGSFGIVFTDDAIFTDAAARLTARLLVMEELRVQSELTERIDRDWLSARGRRPLWKLITEILIDAGFSVNMPDLLEWCKMEENLILTCLAKQQPGFSVRKGAAEMLLETIGIIPVSMVSGQPSSRVSWTVEMAGLMGYFGDKVIVGETCPGTVEPTSSQFAAAAKVLECERVFAVVTSVASVNAAREAGLPVIAMATGDKDADGSSGLRSASGGSFIFEWSQLPGAIRQLMTAQS